MPRILILGGTTESRQIAENLVESGFEVITSLAGRTQDAIRLPGQIRVGGFGGAVGLADYLAQAKIDVVLDATHPFAARISQQAAIATAYHSIPRLMVVRPGWEPQPDDRWLPVASWAEAVDLLPQIAQRIFLTIGRQELGQFAALQSLWFLMRVLEPLEPGVMRPPGVVVCDRPPFSLTQEGYYLHHYHIDTLVTKNSGGSATAAKLQAARAQAIQVVMIQRPPLPDGDQVATPAAALRWLTQQL